MTPLRKSSIRLSTDEREQRNAASGAPSGSTAPATHALRSRKSLPAKITICLLDEDTSALEITTRLLLSAGYRVRPFKNPDPFFECARIHSPQFAIVNFGGANATGLKVAARLRELSPTTSVMISLKVCHGRVRRLLPGNELLNLIERECIARSSRLAAKGTRPRPKELEFGHCN
jgi:hypothetical protein